MSKCCPILCFTSSPFLHPSSHSLSLFQLLLQPSLPSPDLAHRPALRWLLLMLLLIPPFLSLFLPSSSFFTQQSLYSVSFVFELSGFSQSLFSVRVPSFLPSLPLSHFSSRSHNLSHLLILFFPSIFSSHCPHLLFPTFLPCCIVPSLFLSLLFFSLIVSLHFHPFIFPALFNSLFSSLQISPATPH